MTLAGLAVLLQSTGLPVTYRAWPENEAPRMPFLCYLVTDFYALHADGENYYRYHGVRVELYTAFKDPVTEDLVELALAGFHWKKEETYLDSERCYLITYDIEV